MRRCHGCMREYRKEFDVCPHCGYIVDTAPKIKSHLSGGTILAERYMLGKVLGHGGFGITYIAWDKKLNRTVAIKEFFPNALSTRSEGETHVSCYDDKASKFFQDGVKKMLDEGTRLSKFTDNENIVNVYDCFEENNTAYIVMEYLEGGDLKKHIEKNGGKLSPETAVEMILPVLNALEDMHKENLIHRDISPDNIFLCKNGKIKLLDFGSARLAIEDSDKSLSVMVKRGYAPKEQYASRSKQGPWTDVYAVCATLYKMITGELPTESTERDEEPLKKFSEFGITGCSELEKVIFKGLEVEIGNRIQNVSELKAMLEKTVRKAPKYDPPPKLPIPEIPEPPKKAPKKLNPKIRNVIIAAASVAVIIAVAFATIKFLPEKQKGDNESASDAVFEITETLNNASADVIYESFLSSETLSDNYPVIDAFIKKDISLMSDDEKMLFDAEVLNITSLSSAVVKKDFCDFDKDGTEEMLLSLDINGEDTRVKAYLFDLDENKNIFMAEEWDILAPSRTYNHLSVMSDTDGNYYFLEFESDGQHGKSCQKSVYDGEKLKSVLSLSVPDYNLLGYALPDWRKCTTEGKSLYLHGAAEVTEPSASEVEFLTYEEVCDEWEKLFSGTKVTGFCDSSAEELGTRCKLVKEGKYNDYLTWRFYDDRCLIIEGEGLLGGMNDESWDTIPRQFDLLIIGNGITVIENDEFSWDYSFKKVIIPNTLQTINEYAFYATGLKEIHIPASVSHIGDRALDSARVFVNNDNAIYWTDDQGALFLKNKYNSLIHIPYCDSYTIPSGVTEIKSGVLTTCSVNQLFISETVESIYDSYNFASETFSIGKFIVDKNNKNYSSDEYGVLFNKDKTVLIRFPFSNEIKSYTIPYGVTYIAPGAFSFTSALEEIIIPETITELDADCFNQCSANTITIPKSIISIKKNTFEYFRPTDIYYEGTPLQWAAIKIEEGNESLTNATIHYNS